MVNDLKELEKLLKLCRKQGVSELSFDGILIKFGELPAKQAVQSEEEETQTETLTDDELIYQHIMNGNQP